MVISRKEGPKGRSVKITTKGVYLTYYPSTGKIVTHKNLWGIDVPDYSPNEKGIYKLLKVDPNSLKRGKKPLKRKPKSGICCDASCDGYSKGNCEIAITDTKGNKILKESIGIHTNNFAELFAVKRAVEYAIRNDVRTIWTDSENAIAWLRSGPRGHVIERGDVLKVLKDVWDVWTESIDLKKWFTRKWGEIPADFKRKKKKNEPPAEKEELKVERKGSDFEYRIVLVVVDDEKKESKLTEGLLKKYNLNSYDKMQNFLDTYSKEGWELVSVVQNRDGNYIHYFKKLKE